MEAITMKQARVGIGFTQGQMAAALGCNINTYRKWEMDSSGMPVGAAKKFLTLTSLKFDEVSFASKVNLK